jgi:tRNA A37 threonylcarbamoyladenosine modification protein TsaB
MKILALEISSALGSIAFLDSGEHTQKANPARTVLQSAPSPTDLLFEREWPNDRKNSGPFFEHLAEVHKQFGNADTIIVGLGPGSYAGTRIAISTAIGLSFGGTGGACPELVERVRSEERGRHGGRPSIRLIGYPSICAIECNVPEYCVIGDGRRNSFFYVRVCHRDLADGPTLMSEAELREKLVKIDKKMSIFSTEKLPQFERVELCYPAARMLAQLATDSKRKFTQPPLEPMYLREPHITVPKK